MGTSIRSGIPERSSVVSVTVRPAITTVSPSFTNTLELGNLLLEDHSGVGLGRDGRRPLGPEVQEDLSVGVDVGCGLKDDPCLPGCDLGRRNRPLDCSSLGVDDPDRRFLTDTHSGCLIVQNRQARYRLHLGQTHGLQGFDEADESVAPNHQAGKEGEVGVGYPGPGIPEAGHGAPPRETTSVPMSTCSSGSSRMPSPSRSAAPGVMRFSWFP